MRHSASVAIIRTDSRASETFVFGDRAATGPGFGARPRANELYSSDRDGVAPTPAARRGICSEGVLSRRHRVGGVR